MQGNGIVLLLGRLITENKVPMKESGRSRRRAVMAPMTEDMAMAHDRDVWSAGQVAIEKARSGVAVYSKETSSQSFGGSRPFRADLNAHLTMLDRLPGEGQKIKELD